MSRVLKWLCCGVVMVGMVGSASADLIVYDGFDYPEGTIAGNAGGAGWDAGVAWDGGQNIVAPGLAWPDLEVAGNKVGTASTVSYRLMPSGFDASNRTIWISFLCASSATPSWSGISPFTDGSEAIFLGKPDGSATWGIALYNAAGDAGAVTGSKLSEMPTSEQALLVVRIVNGTSSGRITAWLNPDLGREPAADTAFYDSELAGEVVGRVLFDRIRIGSNGEFFYDELRIGDTYADVSGMGGPEFAANPAPEEEATDVPRDVVLGWTAGEFAATHDVYFGTSFDDVNAASRANPLDVLLSQGQAATGYDPAGLLEFETTYYWRVDEVNAAPDNAIFKGEIWSFTSEPFAYPVTGIVATSNGDFDAAAGPEKTVNGSGLNAADQHSTEAGDMWVAYAPDEEPLYLQYEFDRVYKLHEMLVWNYNVQFELLLGFGLKDVTVEYSVDGQEWTALGDFTFAQATAKVTYAANTTVPFDGVPVKYVRLNVNSAYGTMGQYGLGEVRFLYIPAQAREPQPADGATGVDVTTALNWRAGRDAVSHDVYFGTDADALDPAVAVSGASYAPGALNLATTYYWQVDAVQEAESWEGAVWSFTTEEYLVVDGFESYTDDIEAGEAIFDTWLDGWVNNTGSTVGHLNSPFAEQSIIRSGRQSMPLFYDNTTATVSEADFKVGADWTTNGIQSLSLYFYGDPDNTGQLYVKINGTKVPYDGAAAGLKRPAWQPWNIDLSAIGGAGNVQSLTIGVEGAGATGVVYIDDVRLYPAAPEYIVPVEPDPAGLVAYYSFDGNVNDGSGNGHHGTVQGAPTYAAGLQGNAISLNGTTDYVSTDKSASDLGIAGNGPRTVTVWVYTRSFANGAIYDMGARNEAQDFSLRTLDSVLNRWRVQYWGGDYDFTYDTADRWVHFAHVHDGTHTKIYADGMLIVNWEKTIDTADDNPFQIGRYGWPDAYFNGLIDELRLYNRALSAEEILGAFGQTEPAHKAF